MSKKLEILHRFCDEYGMKINVSKTKFFLINGVVGDTRPMHVDGMTIEHCDSYNYLGSPFTCDGSVTSAVKEHARSKLCHVLKFVSFVKKNNDVPFIVKRRVFDAALMSSLLYGCESWVGADVKPVIKLYNWAMKELLGVRKTTTNIVCYAELGYPSLPDLIKYRQHNFFKRMWTEKNAMNDDPLSFAMGTVVASNMPVAKIVQNIIHTNVPNMSELINKVHLSIANSDASKCVVYKEINPRFEVHEIYKSKHALNDLKRISFSRFQVSGHSLAIETGHWNRRGRGRLPVEERLCDCGLIQTERHVLEECPKTQHLRNSYGIRSLNDLFYDSDSDAACNIVHDIFEIYK